MNSPIVYHSDNDYASLLHLAVENAFRTVSNFYHYRSQANTCLRRFYQSDSANVKKLLYAIRTLHCAKYVFVKNSPAPVKINRLLDETVADASMRNMIDELIEIKSQGQERMVIEPREELLQYVHHLQAELSDRHPQDLPRINGEFLDAYFRAILKATV